MFEKSITYRDMQDIMEKARGEQMRRIDERVRWAYSPPLPHTVVTDRDPYADMTAWRHAYMTRTEPTWTECVAYERRGDDSYQGNGLMQVSAESTVLAESSDLTGYQSGWYAVRPDVSWDESRHANTAVPHLIVRRVYLETENRELIYARRTYQHPSREWAFELARQILHGQIPVWGWRRSHHTWDMARGFWSVVQSLYVGSVTVFEQPTRGQTSEDVTTVTRQWLKERGS